MASNEEINPMLTTNEVARLLNVHINTVRRWSNQGILKTYRIGSRGDRRFRRDDITNFLLNKSEIIGAETNDDKEILSMLSSVLEDGKKE